MIEVYNRYGYNYLTQYLKTTLFLKYSPKYHQQEQYEEWLKRHWNEAGWSLKNDYLKLQIR